MLTRRRFTELSSMAGIAAMLARHARAAAGPTISLEIAPYTVEASPRNHFKTVAYNGQVPGPLLRMKQDEEITVQVRNQSASSEIVHWHGLTLPAEIDGAMEEGTPMIAPGMSATYTFRPNPAGFRWYHTHTFAGKDFTKAQFGGLHGFLMIDALDNPARYDREIFLALHDWGGRLMGSVDGSMSPSYDASTINGKMLGFGEPVRVKQGERVLFHVLNSSPTETHWISCSGHQFQVLALDGNTVATPAAVSMLRLAPAERVSAIVEMTNPGVWILGEVRRHVQAAGMGVVLEYADFRGKPAWRQPEDLTWDYSTFDAKAFTGTATPAIPIELTFHSRFQGHGAQELWQINGKSYPNTDEPVLRAGQRYRMILKNMSADDHPLHLHRHTFEVRRIGRSAELSGLRKDVVLVPAQTVAEVEFIADNPGRTLFHCHQQDHMDRGFMMVFQYA
jgi:FtsP/CotA-like multicopper oxidase with cupredoxin domain